MSVNTIEFHNRKLIVADESMETTLELARRGARTEAPVLIAGESGTGKELVARFIHEKSQRAGGPFVSVNCAAIPEGLLEAEFFGHERGAFTGAIAQKIGKFERAKGGTLLLDEISEMPFPLQAKLLRVLQEGELDRLGGGAPVAIDCRVIATTNRDPLSLIREGKFREDLYFRLNVIRVDCTPLRGRRDAVQTLAAEFVKKSCDKFGMPQTGITKEGWERLLSYEWPGNIRELLNAIERGVLLADGAAIGPEHLVGLIAIARDVEEEPHPVSLAELEKRHIEKTLARTAGHQEKAAAILGITSRTLRNKLKVFGQAT